MTDINLKTLTPDTSLPTTGFLFGADSQASTNPSVYGVTTAITTILGNAASSDVLAFNSDTIVLRDASNIFAQRNSTTAQAFRAYNTYTDASNYERGVFDWKTNANVLTIGTEKLGTGTARGLRFVAGGSTALTIGTDGVSSFFAIGVAASATLNVTTNGTSNPDVAYFTAPSMNTSNTVFMSLGKGTGTRNLASFGFYYAGAGSSSNSFTVAFYGTQNVWGVNADTTNTIMFLGGQTSSFPALKRSSTTLQARLADDSAFASVQGKLTTDTAYTAGTVVPTGYITIYDSTGTAYRVPCLV